MANAQLRGVTTLLIVATPIYLFVTTTIMVAVRPEGLREVLPKPPLIGKCVLALKSRKRRNQTRTYTKENSEDT